jgi:microcystin-dependent protein
MTSTLRVNAANTARTKPTTGDTKMSFVNVDHLGWLLCDGREMDIVADNLLFQVIGYSFGHGSGTKFKLPNPAGRVMGTVGTVTDDAVRSRTYAKGQSVGELDHKLTIGEMPAHNHNDATASPGANTIDDGITSVQADHIHSITDETHQHTYTAPSGSGSTSSYSGIGSIGVITGTNSSALTTPALTGITETNLAGAHSHTISSNGNNEYHNNIQPTLFYGNTFIYCGVPMRGEFPFKTGLAPVLI